MQPPEPRDDPNLTKSSESQDIHQWHVDINLQLRMDFITACGGLLTAQDVSDLTGQRTGNWEQSPQDLETSGKIFSVQIAGKKRFPYIQFDHETKTIRKEVARIIESLKGEYSGWSFAIWWASANAWLDGIRPIDIWPTQAERVAKSAESEATMFATICRENVMTSPKRNTFNAETPFKRKAAKRTYQHGHTRRQSIYTPYAKFLAQQRWPCEPLSEAGDGSGDLILSFPEGLVKHARLRVGEAVHIVARQGALCIWKVRKPRPLQTKSRRALPALLNRLQRTVRNIR